MDLVGSGEWVLVLRVKGAWCRSHDLGEVLDARGGRGGLLVAHACLPLKYQSVGNGGLSVEY